MYISLKACLVLGAARRARGREASSRGIQGRMSACIDTYHFMSGRIQDVIVMLIVAKKVRRQELIQWLRKKYR
jgi:hypothetical protein